MLKDRRQRAHLREPLPLPPSKAADLEGAGVLSDTIAWPIDLSARTKTAIALAGCVLLAALLAFAKLDARGIFSPAEARYSLIAREMAESGDWIQPRLNHVRYDEKPPLLYWALAVSYRWLGETDFASRVPSALAYVGTTAATFGMAYELLGPPCAPLAALIYTTCVGTFLFGRFVFTDTLLIFCTTLSLYGMSRMIRRRPGAAPALLFYLGMSLAGLTKGLIGLLLPLATAASYALAVDDPAFRRRTRPWLGAIVIGAVFVPWHVLLALRDPAFVDSPGRARWPGLVRGAV